jgi:hypothetical protein
MTRTQMDDNELDGMRYEVRLLIRHPTIDPDRITNTLRLKPHLSAMVGSARTNSSGDVLPGLHKDSVWSVDFGVGKNRRFLSDIAKLIEKLEPHKVFLHEIVNGGGSINLIVSLPGDVNIGDNFHGQDMARLCALRIDLGIEVFPDFN